MRISTIFLLPYACCKVSYEVAQAIQESRKSYNLKPLEIIQSVIDVSRDRVEELAESYEKYSNSDYLRRVVEKHGIRPFAMGENNGKSRNKENNGLDIFEEWLRSEKHRKNIVKTPEYTHLGVYMLKTETNLYISAVFFQMKETQSEIAKIRQEMEKEHDLGRGMSIRSSYIDKIKKTVPMSMLYSAPEKTEVKKAISSQINSPALSNPTSLPTGKDAHSSLQEVSTPFSTVQLVYPNSLDIKNLSPSNTPIQFVYQPSEPQKQKTSQNTSSEGVQGTPDSLSSNQLSSANKAEPSSPNSNSNSNENPNASVNPSPNTNPDANSNPNQKTIIKLIMVQPVSNNSSNPLEIVTH
ncbi:hypothetical protein NEMIN01_1716 [Nematocida minor]|uniref:uncharacterized protein n=1 Tax=Nematocida minor TaxID=1912983 RepID=UPI00221F5443|nr:uncharacterized protein NEMIN01_1716 [Nematocida minor]KAI5191861.1 hypothetical protein NEMIN01_1716 [Nematocida minor]